MKGVHQWVTRIGTTRLLFSQRSCPASPPCDNFSARYYPALDAAIRPRLCVRRTRTSTLIQRQTSARPSRNSRRARSARSRRRSPFSNRHVLARTYRFFNVIPLPIGPQAHFAVPESTIKRSPITYLPECALAHISGKCRPIGWARRSPPRRLNLPFATTAWRVGWIAFNCLTRLPAPTHLSYALPSTAVPPNALRLRK